MDETETENEVKSSVDDDTHCTNNDNDEEKVTKKEDHSSCSPLDSSSALPTLTPPKKTPPQRCVSFGDEVHHCQQDDEKSDEYQDGQITPSTDSNDDDEETGQVGKDQTMEPPDMSRPKLYRRSSSQASQHALESFRQSLRRVEFSRQMSSSRHGHHDGPFSEGGAGTLISGGARWRPWASWTLPRFQKTTVGVLSSTAVLVIRLYLDPEPTVYLIHSIVVFLDMVLIHIFTNSPWLSVTGELVTILSFLAFHFTKETLFELLETTLIAVLCSFHLILSRNKHMDSEKVLETNILDLRKTSLHLLRHLDEMDEEEVAEQFGQDWQDDTSSVETVGENTSKWFGYQHDHEACKQHLKYCGEHFFEYFLDGSAGVMYTSFLGLIISEVLTYGQEKKY